MMTFVTDFTTHGLLVHFNTRAGALLLIAATIWSLAWKGFALWASARNYQKNWFIALLILNTLGILEIIYLVWFRRDKQEGVTKSLFNNPLPEPTDDTSKEVVA